MLFTILTYPARKTETKEKQLLKENIPEHCQGHMFFNIKPDGRWTLSGNIERDVQIGAPENVTILTNNREPKLLLDV